MHAVSRLLASALDAAGPSVVQGALVREARQLFGVRSVFLLSVDPQEHLARVVAYDSVEPPGATRVAIVDLPDGGRSIALSDGRAPRATSASTVADAGSPIGM